MKHKIVIFILALYYSVCALSNILLVILSPGIFFRILPSVLLLCYFTIGAGLFLKYEGLLRFIVGFLFVQCAVYFILFGIVSLGYVFRLLELSERIAIDLIMAIFTAWQIFYLTRTNVMMLFKDKGEVAASGH